MAEPLFFLEEEVVNLNLAHYCQTMAWEKCENCNQEFFKKIGVDSCPNCAELIGPHTPVKLPTELKENLIEKARNQARIVDKFGEVLQVIGYIFIIIFAIGFLVSLFTKNWIGFIIFLIAIPATFISYNVFGSAVRAVALYIQVKVK